ncbi:MAG: alanine--glyoxylate aminotransferase family protein [Bacteroidetes bacterium]|nr:alanine--glyoxylate aminotransferase family protein [Rhodothermia bacterium]MCX7906291.1 alanine--glyoxylate aminotransferase family protein [Bacteroidota bacterium]MDW8285679.1 alanine--glyoxylate aminotransferase family protein [Bacteroidota bacterium]
MYKMRLFTPGPTPVPESVLLALARPVLHHRHAEFRALFAEHNRLLGYLFQTEQPVLSLTCSGTGAMEAAVVHAMRQGAKALYVAAGKFGERWGEILRAYGLRAVPLAIPWGQAPAPEQLEEALRRHPDVRAVFLTHSETSTGTWMDVRALAESVRRAVPEALVIVDGITAVGAHELRMDLWDLDVVITGSQKGVMVPPGLAYIALSARAWERARESDLPRYYFDLLAARQAYEQGDTPWTPAVSLIVAACEALRRIAEEGLENVWSRHARLARAFRAGAQAIGLRLASAQPSNALTALWLPDGVSWEALNRALKRRGLTVAEGQGPWRGRVFRVSHLGYYDAFDMLAAMAAIEEALQELDYPFEPGSGVVALQRALLETEQEA